MGELHVTRQGGMHRKRRRVRTSSTSTVGANGIAVVEKVTPPSMAPSTAHVLNYASLPSLQSIARSSGPWPLRSRPTIPPGARETHD